MSWKNYILISVLCVTVTGALHAQSRVVINGGYINIENGGKVVVTDSTTAAITRLSGHIISEAESDEVIWHINSSSGTFLMPFGFSSTDYLPLSFNKTTGNGSGSIRFSTYRTGNWQNSLFLPSIVTHLNNNSGTDNSANVIDRFWQLNASSYLTIPELTDLVFTYADIEHSVVSNTITESNLMAQRWNSTSSVWGDWGPLGTDNATLNTVTVNTVNGSDFFEWWTLVDLTVPLPIELSSIWVDCDSGKTIYWTTNSEFNSQYFTLEKSRDQYSWQIIDSIAAAGNSSEPITYSLYDPDESILNAYYRLKQYDNDGSLQTERIISANCNLTDEWEVYPNPATDNFTVVLSANEVVELLMMDISGKIIHTQQLYDQVSLVDLKDYASGVYIVRLADQKGNNISIRLMKE